MAWLLGRYSVSYASNQYRALQQFFKWLAAEDEMPDPMAGLKPPHVADKPVPVFTGQELARLECACAGRGFGQRRDAAIMAVFRACGIRLSELAGIRYDPDGPRRGDVDLQEREITVQGKGRKTRTVRIGYDAARSLDRYLRLRAGRPLAHRPELWLGASNRGPLTASGVCQVIACRGRQCDDGAQRLDLPADAPPLRCQRPQRPGAPNLRPRHGGRLIIVLAGDRATLTAQRDLPP